jgi:hypothetical protein
MTQTSRALLPGPRRLRAAGPRRRRARRRRGQPDSPPPGVGSSKRASARPVSGYKDETLAFDATQVAVSGGPGIPVTVMAVRRESTVDTFMSLSPFEPPTVPQDVIKAQLMKLA